jgi:dUTPase
MLRFVRLNEEASSPTYGSLLAAGADLYSAEKCMIPSKGEKI